VYFEGAVLGRDWQRRGSAQYSLHCSMALAVGMGDRFSCDRPLSRSSMSPR
jgi:hypothetical protein